jgi:hypothetical protein
MRINRAAGVVALTACGLAFGAVSATAAEGAVPCGAPAVDAVYRTVVTPAVPAVTHTEWRWALWGTPTVYQWRRWVVTVPGQDAVWHVIQHPAVTETYVVSPGQPAWDEQVLVSAAWDEDVLVSPAEYQTLYEFVHRNGRTRTESDRNWNADSNPNSNGWTYAGEVQVLVTEAVYESVHHDAVYETVHHDAVTEVRGERVVTPAWEERVLVTAAVEEQGEWQNRWKPEGEEPAGSGWELTGESRPGEPEVLESRWATESPGEDWVNTQEQREVVDTEAVPETTEQVLVHPAVPAGQPCPPEGTEPEPTSPGQAPGGTTAEPAPKPTPKPATRPATSQAASAVPAVATPEQLPYTGSDLTLLWVGLGSLAGGVVLTAGYRRASTKA